MAKIAKISISTGIEVTISISRITSISTGTVVFAPKKGMNPNNLVAPIPGPTWLPQSAESVQNRLKNGIYTASKCVGEPPYRN